MEALYAAVALLCAVVISVQARKFLNWSWFQPKKVEQRLRQQGFRGNSYKYLIGDYNEISINAKKVGPKPIPFTNDILERALGYVHESIQNFGENCFIWFGPSPTVIISDPKMIREILSKNFVFQQIETPLNEQIGTGLAAYNKDKWAKHRRLITPAFQLEKLKNMLPSFYFSCADMLSKWEEIVPNEGSCELDAWPYLETLTSDAISRTAFGSNYEEGQHIFELQKELQGLLSQSIATILIPGWRFIPTKVNRRIKKISEEVGSSILEIIHKGMQAIESGEDNSEDLLGILLEFNLTEIKQNGNEFGMSFQDVVEECKLFYIAGQITTASLLVWTMLLLGKHLDWQERAREEVVKLLASDTLPDFHTLSHLKIVTMIFHEVLRLYPPVPMLTRTIHEETAVGSMTLPAGVQLILPTISLHHDTKIWGEDAEEFNPERFSEGVSKATKGQFVYFPFGGGPRTCIGQSFAMLEAKMALAIILRRFAFEVSSSYAHAPDSVFSLQPKHGAQLLFRKIRT